MIGLPYPNPNDPVLIEKMTYINNRLKDKNAGNEYYENLCMKAVNQSIGNLFLLSFFGYSLSNVSYSFVSSFALQGDQSATVTIMQQ